MVPRQFVLIGTTNAKIGHLRTARAADGSGLCPSSGSTSRHLNVTAMNSGLRQRRVMPMRLRFGFGLNSGRQRLTHKQVRRATDPWEPILEPVFGAEVVPVHAVWAALDFEASRLDNRHADRVAAIAQRFGFTRKDRLFIEGKQRWCGCVTES